MEASSTTLILKVLDALSQRAVVTAENIANASTQNYRPLRVTFEDALRDAAREGDGAVAHMTPRVAPVPPSASEGQLRLDLEMASQSSTALRYSALIDVLTRQMQLASVAIEGTN